MRQHQKNCIECNTPFTSKRSDAKYCSGACKQYFSTKNRGLKMPSLYELTIENNRMKTIIKGYLSAESTIVPHLPADLKKLYLEFGKVSKDLVP